MSAKLSGNVGCNNLNSVVTKIFGVIALCLGALLCVASVAIYQFAKIGEELDSIAEFDAPITAALTQVTIHQLEQAILFERAMRAGEVMADHPETRAEFEESKKKFYKYNAMIAPDIERLQSLLSDAKANGTNGKAIELYISVSREIAQIHELHQLYSDRVRKAYQLVSTGAIDDLLKHLPLVTQEEDQLDHDLERLLLQVEQFTITAAKTADAHEEAALVQLIWISTIAILLGSAAAWVGMRRYLTRPLSEVSSSVAALSRGDLDIDVVKRRDDEIGVIAEGLIQFRENARRIDALSREKDQNDKAAEANRRAMMADLQEAFGSVVDNAVGGDFSGRVSATFQDAELNHLAQGVNRLLEAVDVGINETGRVLRHITAGDLTERMNGAFTGAFADLQHNVNETTERLADLVSNISTTTSGLQRSADSISSGSVGLASRAEQQAASLEETAATMEEISGSVKANAERAGGASDLAAKTWSEADAGGEVVKNAISAVSEIEQSSSQIADIVTVIDGIAFQTNLLALNAAVEAARAGDAGKGFAVVASEVRALAQRSSDAAHDIRELIATSAGHVERGVRLVTDTGKSLEGIVSSISKVEGAIREIAAANAEQSNGVQEITVAIRHLDEITQSNSALADEGASNSRALTSDAQTLQDLIGFFEGARKGHDMREHRKPREAAVAAASPIAAAPPAAAFAAASDDWAEF